MSGESRSQSDPQLGDGVTIQSDVVLEPGENDGESPVIGDRSTIRSGAVIYPDVVIGSDLSTGHDIVVREQTEIGDDVTVGTKTVIDGHTTIGDRVSLQTGVYIPVNTQIGDDVFVGPNAVFTNDPYPARQDVDLVGPTLADGVSIGANATLLPGVNVGAGSFVAAGAVVTEDVPPRTLAVGTPATHRELPPQLDAENDIA